MKKRTVVYSLVIILILLIGWWAWSRFASPTKVALINFQKFQTTSIIKSNNDDFVTYSEIDQDNLDQLKKYDFILGFGMGMNITTDQRAKLQEVIDKDIPIYVYGATSPENNIFNIDSIQKKSITDYLSGGNKVNYENMSHYIRQNIDTQKKFFVTQADSASEGVSDVLYHLDDKLSFESVEEYEKYLKDNKIYKEGAPKVALVGGLNDPFGGNRDNIDSLIVSFQNSGLNVYPISSWMKRLPFLRQIKPDAVIYYAHGRLAMGQADAAVEWLKEQNIPIFAPFTILETQERWEDDPMDMMGGFMSQSVVVPELDGAIYPYVLNVEEIDKDGLYLFKAIPERLHKFNQIVNNFIALKKKSNADKKIAIYYFKGPGQETLTAQGLESIPSLYNLLLRLRNEGYKVDNLPTSEAEFEKLLMTQGAVLSTYAEGAFDDYLQNGHPALVAKTDYEGWLKKSLSKKSYDEVVSIYGEAPGAFMSTQKDGKDYLAVARIELGNIALLPQPMAAIGDDSFAIVHGAKTPPPHTYIGAYLWSQYDFGADAMLHFGTHGSLEFTPQKQIALCTNDWPEILVGTIPHFYYYTIGNIGESMMAKRRTYATLISYLTPPFMESETRMQFRDLQNKIQDYYKTDEKSQAKASLVVKKIAVEMGLHRELRLDSILTNPYTMEEIEKLENFAEEIANEKMTGQMYVTGVPYDAEKINTTVLAMSAEPIAYSLAALDKNNGKITDKDLKSKAFFTKKYLDPSKKLVNEILNGKIVDTMLICQVAGITQKELQTAKQILNPPRQGMREAMAQSSSQGAMTKSKNASGGHPAWIPKIGKKPDNVGNQAADTTKVTTTDKTKEQPQYTKAQKDDAGAIVEVERTLLHVVNYKKALQESPEMEMKSMLNALAGGYVAPSSGGDAIANPAAIPTGRNLYAINAEATPSEVAWDRGVDLVNETLEQYKKQHGDYPKKVSYTFWSSEFIESEGTTVAQVLYMLGVEPVRDAFGRVSDIQLIPSEKLGRPRIDVIVQTSGQFRDLAASRLALISRAVEMSAAAKDDKYENLVAESTVQLEKDLVDQGIPPKDARDMASMRVFGGVNGMYGTNIQGMVKSGDKWEDTKDIADTYIQNMGAVYGTDKVWGKYQEGLLRAALKNTDIVVQPRQSNTWGALSLDHVFEFMGGLNIAVRDVTGKEPDAYFADYRNRNNAKMQDLKEAIGVESRATVFNPVYIKEVMKGKASSAAQITEVVTNTYAWNVLKPEVIDEAMWDKMYDVYVKDSYGLGVQDFYKKNNPQAMQEITAVMMETARKGMWNASSEQLSSLANLHADLVKEFGTSGSGFSGSNAKLQDFIAKNTTTEKATAYKQQIQKMKTANADTEGGKSGTVLKKEQVGQTSENGEQSSINKPVVVIVVIVAFVVLLMILRQKRKK